MMIKSLCCWSLCRIEGMLQLLDKIPALDRDQQSDTESQRIGVKMKMKQLSIHGNSQVCQMHRLEEGCISRTVESPKAK